ncbi:helix-turn-helix domain-containing protein [Streptomyces sp. NBC_01210]|uniref:helix-turn-helix domain-containing protein n=1 Tax=Streptomyces sp. NBC_01210 TaxID=2903774 RepID=UPI002E0E9141|nr:helix-turn-helix domain-containing protein [Streptomyces sp. NBC_01210]
MQAFRGIDWNDLPQGLASALTSSLPRLSEEIVTRIRQEIPEFSDVFQGPYRRRIRQGVERALSEFVLRVSRPTGTPWPSPEAAELYRALGRGEMHGGRSLDALQAAYRLGARLAWRRWIEVGTRQGVSPAKMYRLAEAVFAYIDELSRLTVEGYNQAAAGNGDEKQRRRTRLVQALTAQPSLSVAVLEQLADAAEWPLPPVLSGVALAPAPLSAADAQWSEHPLSDEVLFATDGPLPFLFVPDWGPDTGQRVRELVEGRHAAVGPPVAIADAAWSLVWARELLELGARGLEGRPDVLIGADHLCTMVLLKDEHLVRVLIEQLLRPLRGLTGKQQARFSDTLLAWIETAGNAREAAANLGVHPQTVRSRVRRIEQLFGDELRLPERRFEMEVALRARRLGRGLSPAVQGKEVRPQAGAAAAGPEATASQNEYGPRQSR